MSKSRIRHLDEQVLCQYLKFVKALYRHHLRWLDVLCCRPSGRLKAERSLFGKARAAESLPRGVGAGEIRTDRERPFERRAGLRPVAGLRLRQPEMVVIRRVFRV